MSTALAVHHGAFGRASLYRLNKPLATHAHREGHLIFHVDGPSCGLEVDGHWCPLSPTHCVAVNPLQPHNFQPGDSISGAVFLTLYINPSWFLEFGRDNGHALQFGANSLEVNGEIAGLARQVSMFLVDDLRGARFDACLYELTATSFEQSRIQATGNGTGHAVWSGVSDYRIRNSIRLMRDLIGDEIVLDQVAQAVGLSRPHFFKLFRQNIGVTPNIYLNTLRMESSIERLTCTNDSITTIGLDMGFASQASFTRFFSSNVGIPPSDYRRAALHLA